MRKEAPFGNGDSSDLVDVCYGEIGATGKLWREANMSSGFAPHSLAPMLSGSSVAANRD